MTLLIEPVSSISSSHMIEFWSLLIKGVIGNFDPN